MNEPAFPVRQDVNGYVNQYSGMTLRDYFAAKAMQAIIARGWEVVSSPKWAYEVADAMLKSRTEPKL